LHHGAIARFDGLLDFDLHLEITAGKEALVQAPVAECALEGGLRTCKLFCRYHGIATQAAMFPARLRIFDRKRNDVGGRFCGGADIAASRCTSFDGMRESAIRSGKWAGSPERPKCSARCTARWCSAGNMGLFMIGSFPRH